MPLEFSDWNKIRLLVERAIREAFVRYQYGSGGTPTVQNAIVSPSGAAGGDLSGSYPNPSVVDDSHNHTAATLPATLTPGDHTHAGAGNGGTLNQANTHGSPDTDVGPTSLHHTLGSGVNQAAAGNHSHGLAGHTIEHDESSVTPRSKLDFTGDGVNVTDDAGNDRTVVTVTGGGGGGDPVLDAMDLSGWIAGGVLSDATLNVQEADGAPAITNVTTIKFPNGSVTDAGGGVATIAFPAAPTIAPRQVVFTVAGALSVAAGVIRIFNNLGVIATITKVMIAANTAPTTQAIIVDVHKGGTTIFTNQAHRPQIAAAANTGSTTDIDVASWADGEYLTVDVDQVGTGTLGSDLTVHIVFTT